MAPAQRVEQQEESPERACRRLLAAQSGVIHRVQAIELGMSSSAVGRRLQSGEWVVMVRSTYRAAEVAESWRQRVVAGILWLTSGVTDPAAPIRKAVALSHLAAARHWAMAIPRYTVVELSAKSSRRSPASWLRIHQSHLLEWDVTQSGSIVATNPTRTLIDIAGALEEERLESVLEDSIRRRLTSIARLRWRLDRYPGQGKNGIGLLRSLVEARSARMPALESPLELKLERILSGSRLPLPQRQVRILDGGRFLARVDFAYPTARVAIEADSYRFHGDAAGWRRDRRRQKAIERLGWVVLRFTSEDLEDPAQVIADVHQALVPRLSLEA